MGVRDRSNKPKTKPSSEKQPEIDAVGLSKKELLMVYNLSLAFAKLLEEARKTHTQFKPKMRLKMVQPAKDEKLPKHLDRAITAADTWQKRDLLCRRMSAFYHGIAKSFMAAKDFKNAYKWATLSLRYLRLSMDPKKQVSEEQLRRLEDMVHEIEEHQREEENQQK